MRIAVIRNPLSRSNLGRQRPPQTLRLPMAEPRNLAELQQALTQFRADGTQIVAVDGGDGTVREVATALMALDWRPRLVLLPSGKINLIARDVGFARPDQLARLAGGDIQVRRRHLLRLDHAGGASFGMLLGGAGFRLAWEMANRVLHPHGLVSRAAVAAALMVSLARAASGGRFAAGDPMALRLDDGEVTAGNRFLLLATTLDRLMLGLWPFWDDGTDQSGVRLLDVAAPPRRLWAALPALARGRPRPWMAAAGYGSTRTQRVEITTSEPVILDGEPFHAGADGRLVLSLGPEMEFLRP